MSDTPYFTCPKCGSRYFGSVIEIVDGDIVVKEVRCHGDSGGPRVCDWRGVWPLEVSDGQ